MNIFFDFFFPHNESVLSCGLFEQLAGNWVFKAATENLHFYIFLKQKKLSL